MLVLLREHDVLINAFVEVLDYSLQFSPVVVAILHFVQTAGLSVQRRQKDFVLVQSLEKYIKLVEVRLAVRGNLEELLLEVF